MRNVREAAARLISEGWRVVPIAPGDKGPRIPGWKDTIFTPEDFDDNSNVGVLNGEPSGWKVDVDLDCKQTVMIATSMLPTTELQHGRASKPASHRWYHCEGAPNLMLKDPVDGSMLVELRSSGGQTVVPPSIHPSGEHIEWSREARPATVQKEILTRTVHMLGIAALLSRHLPEIGSWHDAAGAAAGFLLKCGFTAVEVERIVWQAFVAAGDDKIDDRRRYARDTCARADAHNLTGAPTVIKIFQNGEKVVSRINEWLGRGTDDRIDQLNERHFFVRMGKDAVIATLESDGELVFQTPAAFDQMYCHVPVKGSEGERTMRLGTVWRHHPRRRGYRRVVFSPPPASCDPNDYNIWQGFPLLPSEDTTGIGCRLLLEHIEQNICGVDRSDTSIAGLKAREVHSYLLDWMGAMVQQPGVPGEAAVVMRGSMGAGKGLLVRYLAQLFGKHYIQVDKAKHVTGAFNQHLSGKVLVFADEAVWAGNKSDHGALKRLITEPTITVERKGFDAVQERNVIHLIMATNEGWAIPAGMKERRFLFLDVSSKREQDHAYFAPILDEMNSTGPAALLSYLLARDLSKANLRKVPRTAGLRDQVERSVDPEIRWWRERLENGTLGDEVRWPDWISSISMHRDYLEWTKEVGLSRVAGQVEFGKALRPFLSKPGKDDQHGIIAGKYVSWGEAERVQRVVSLSDEKQPIGRKLIGGKSETVRRWGYVVPSLKDSRARFDNLMGMSGNWDEDPEPAGPEADPSAKDSDLPF